MKESTEYENQSQDEQDQLVEKRNPHKKSYHPQTLHTIHGAHQNNDSSDSQITNALHDEVFQCGSCVYKQDGFILNCSLYSADGNVESQR